MSREGSIVSLLASATEILFGLDLGPRVVAVSHQCDFPAAVGELPRVTGSRIDSRRDSQNIDDQVHSWAARAEPLYTLDEQKIRDLRPRLIVTQAQCDVCAVRFQDVERMVNSAPELDRTEILALQPTRLAEIFSDILRVGSATSSGRQAERWLALLEQRLRIVRQRIAASVRRPRTLCVEWIEPLMLAANWTPDLIAAAGGENGLTSAGQASAYGDWQEVVAFDPEVLLIAPCGLDLRRTLEEAQRLAELPGWTSLQAVQRGQVFAIDGNAYLHRSGPRVVETIELLSHLLHPLDCPAPIASSTGQPIWQRLEAQGGADRGSSL